MAALQPGLLLGPCQVLYSQSLLGLMCNVRPEPMGTLTRARSDRKQWTQHWPPGMSARTAIWAIAPYGCLYTTGRRRRAGSRSEGLGCLSVKAPGRTGPCL